MLKPLLAALALVMALASPAMAQTQRYQLTDQAWVDLGATPLTVRTLGNPALLVIDTTAPSALNAPATVLGSEAQTGLPVTVSGQRVYARALNGSTAVAVLPNPGAGGGGGGGGATGSVTSAGTNGTQAQAVQGIQGGVPLNGFTGQYNSTLPTFTNAQVGYLSVDSNGRQILSPSSSVSVSASALPTGAATAANQTTMAANQNSTPAGTSATNAQGVQGVTGGVPLPVSGTVAISQTTPGTTNGVQVTNQVTQTTTGALQPPTAAAGKITQTSVSLTANTSTSLIAANTARIAVEIQCDGTAPVGVDRTGGTLTSATAAPLVIPSGAYPLYPMPIATLTAITAYTGTAQVCRVTEYNR